MVSVRSRPHCTISEFCILRTRLMSSGHCLSLFTSALYHIRILHPAYSLYVLDIVFVRSRLHCTISEIRSLHTRFMSSGLCHIVSSCSRPHCTISIRLNTVRCLMGSTGSLLLRKSPTPAPFPSLEPPFTQVPSIASPTADTWPDSPPGK